jgi:hypothetical protein
MNRRIGKMRVASRRRINEEISPGGRDQKCVGVQGATGKFFEPNAVCVVYFLHA